MRFARALERKLQHGRRPNRALRKQRGYALELRTAPRHLRAQNGDVAARIGRNIGGGGDIYKAPARPEHGKRTAEHLAADEIEHDVALRSGADEVLRGVIDRLVGAKAPDIFMISAACRR